MSSSVLLSAMGKLVRLVLKVCLGNQSRRTKIEFKPALKCELNYQDQKIRRTPTLDIRKHWTAVSLLLGLISSVYRDLHH